MISKYPSFSKLDLGHKNEVEAITKRFLPYSDFNFTSLFCWDVNGSTFVSVLNDNLSIILPDYISGVPVCSLLGDNKIDESLSLLLRHHDMLRLVPEVTIKAIIHKQKFDIQEDIDNFDYIYKLENLALLLGGNYKLVRNKVNSFKKAYPSSIRINNTSKITPSQKIAVIRLYDEWARSAKQSEENLSNEKIAINRLLEHSSFLNIVITLIATESELIAFSINEVIDKGYAICHFEKALPQYKNVFSFVTNESAKALLQSNCTYVNWEQDLGIEGLRKSKMSYRPDKLLKKYTAKIKSAV